MTRSGKILGWFLASLSLVWLCSVVSVSSEIKAVRGTFFDLVDDPWDYYDNEEDAARFLPDGLLVTKNGIIQDFGRYEELKDKYPGIEITVYKNRIIVPGFIDAHIHFPQTRVIGAYGHHLL